MKHDTFLNPPCVAVLQIVSAPATRLFTSTIVSADKEEHWVEGAYHDMLLGPENTQVNKSIVDWLRRHT